MIMSISSHENNELILDTINEAELNILKSLVDNKFRLSSFIKLQLEQLQAVKILILDLFALEDDEEEILQALKNLRLLYNNIRVIIIAPNRKEGDKLLSEIFCLGIYDIITIDQEDGNYTLKKELGQSLKKGKEFKDSIKFQLLQESDSKQTKSIKEKIIVKNEIRQTVNKALIGFVGTMKRIGVTHNTIVSAHYLKEKGYKVAVVENSLQEIKCFQSIKDSFEDLEYIGEDYFTLNHIDYYEDFNLTELPKILSKNYNFILIDFGLFDSDYLFEFRRCVVQVIVTGSKSWEMDRINEVFKSSSKEELESYSYLFNFTDLKDKDDIRENMLNLNKIFFSGYSPDPFNPVFYNDLDKMFKEYLSQTTEKEVKPSFIKGLLNRIR